MRLTAGLKNITSHAGCVVTIGNFDGIHIGHQKIINYLVAKSKELGLPSVLISFMPSPQHFFGKKEFILSNFKEKYKLIERLKIDEYLIIRFNKQFSELTPECFVKQVLVDKLNTKYCLVGDDFRFGKSRKGDYNLLKSFANKQGFVVQNIEAVVYNNYRVSSSKIRALLKNGEVNLVNKMLGREFSITGRIIHGNKKGRLINFPTINIPIKQKISNVLGVFAVNVFLKGNTYQGVCNVGTRPTIHSKQILLEVFLFNFNEQAYGEYANVIFKHKIRDEQKFDSFSKLAQQIKLDVKSAKLFFANQ